MVIYAPRPVEGNLPRYDRIYEEPSAKNAQGLFPPDACLFIGNLSTKVPLDKLCQDVQALFSTNGPCHVKIKQDRSKGLPGAFVQFERVQDAMLALARSDCTQLHGRYLRIEKARGRRTARMSFRSGDPISTVEVYQALATEGPIEAVCVDVCPHPYNPWLMSSVAMVTFAYVDDFKDAIKRFQQNPVFYLIPTNIEGSPLTRRTHNGHPAQAWVPLPVPVRFTSMGMGIKPIPAFPPFGPVMKVAAPDMKAPPGLDSGYYSHSASPVSDAESGQNAHAASSSGSKPSPGGNPSPHEKSLDPCPDEVVCNDKGHDKNHDADNNEEKVEEDERKNYDICQSMTESMTKSPGFSLRRTASAPIRVSSSVSG